MTVDPNKWYSDDEMLELLAGQYRLVDEEGEERDEEEMADAFLWAIDSNGRKVSSQWMIDQMNEFLWESTVSGLEVSDVMMDEHGTFYWKLVP